MNILIKFILVLITGVTACSNPNIGAQPDQISNTQFSLLATGNNDQRIAGSLKLEDRKIEIDSMVPWHMEFETQTFVAEFIKTSGDGAITIKLIKPSGETSVGSLSSPQSSFILIYKDGKTQWTKR